MNDPKADLGRRLRPVASILVASDAQANSTMVSELLSQEFDGVRTSWIAQSAVPDFDESPPQVLVLAFEELEKAESYYLGLFRLSRVIRRESHRTIVLCQKNEVKRAFELCRTEHFDDYILFWPMSYDGYRLPMAVYNALRHLLAARAQIVRPLTGAAPESMQPAAEPKVRRVLVVDDDQFQRTLLAKYLSAEPYEVMLAADSSEAFALAMADRPDLILMDVMLPHVDGLEATRRIRANPDLAKVPVLILTGKSGRETVIESRRAGATDFMVKPIERKALIAKVREMLGDATKQTE